MNRGLVSISAVFTLALATVPLAATANPAPTSPDFLTPVLSDEIGPITNAVENQIVDADFSEGTTSTFQDKGAVRLTREDGQDENVQQRELGSSHTELGASYYVNNRKHTTRIYRGELLQATAHHKYDTNSTINHGRPNSAITDAPFVGSPVVASIADAEVPGTHIFARTEDGKIINVTAKWEGDEFQQEVWVDGGAVGDPASAVVGDRLNVFYVDSTGALQHVSRGISRDRGMRIVDWSHQAQFTSELQGRPSVIEWNGQVHVFVRDTDDVIRHFMSDSAGDVVEQESWNGAVAIEDPSAVATERTLAVLFADDRGRLTEQSWVTDHADFGTGFHPSRAWYQTSNGQGKSVDDKPQVFVQGGAVHAFTRNVDGSITHYYRFIGQDSVMKDEWAGAGTTDAPISGTNLGSSQEVFFLARGGQLSRMTYDANYASDAAENTWRLSNFGGLVDWGFQHSLAAADKPLGSVVTTAGDTMRYVYTLPTGALMKADTHVGFDLRTVNPRIGTAGSGTVGQPIAWSTKPVEDANHNMESLVGVGVTNMRADLLHVAPVPELGYVKPAEITLTGTTGLMDSVTFVDSQMNDVTWMVAARTDGIYAAYLDADADNLTVPVWYRVADTVDNLQALSVAGGFNDTARLVRMIDDHVSTLQLTPGIFTSGLTMPQWSPLPDLPLVDKTWDDDSRPALSATFGAMDSTFIGVTRPDGTVNTLTIDGNGHAGTWQTPTLQYVKEWSDERVDFAVGDSLEMISIPSVAPASLVVLDADEYARVIHMDENGEYSGLTRGSDYDEKFESNMDVAVRHALHREDFKFTVVGVEDWRERFLISMAPPAPAEDSNGEAPEDPFDDDDRIPEDPFEDSRGQN